MGKKQSSAVQLILNEDKRHEHRASILKNLNKATQFEALIAFAKTSGLNYIIKELRTKLKKGLQARIVIGTDFYITDPKVLETLFKLTKKNGLKLYMHSSGRNYSFHPKIYAFKNSNEVTVIVGSANLTHGGLSSNYEASLSITDGAEQIFTEISEFIDDLINEKEVVEVTSALIDEYSDKHKTHETYRNFAKRSAEKAKPLSSLKSWLMEMKQIKSEFGLPTTSTQSVKLSLCRNALRL